ncbi:polyprenyl synthetase family protein [Bartonella sp. HY328]|uniref:polyprenyl synthetase family protein n=1 Tax=unclassified Bartonella TaxID=2645622 RepID=UPI0039659D79
MDSKNNFEALLLGHAKRVETLIGQLLAPYPQMGEIDRPQKLLDAMRHGVLNGGKRLRPFLILETASLFNVKTDAPLRVAASLEAIHSYSLIHDDLPSMDNDDLRRGKPTVHKAFDEATAILAGDALLTLAFDIIAAEETELKAEARLSLIRHLSRAAGLGGMVGGQILDIEAETKKPDEAGIIMLQAMKTGALIRYACEAGAIIGNATSDDRARLAEFGSAIGLAFQLADDLLDVTADTKTLGKTAGKDSHVGKGTLVALHGIDWAKQQLDGLISQAEELLAPFGNKADNLRNCAYFIAHRDH